MFASRKRVLACTVAAALALVGFGATAAHADPSSVTYVAVGSDTLQDLYNAYQNASGIASYNATIPGQTGDAGLGGTIVPKNSLNANTSNTAIGRPNGSGDGRKALSAAWNTASSTWSQTVVKTSGTTTTSYTVPSQSIDIARASSKPGTTVAAGASNDNLTSVPLARDAVSVATNVSGAASGLASVTFSLPQLEAIFGSPNDATNNPNSAAGKYIQVAGTNTVGDITRGTTAGAKPALVTAVSGGAITAQITLTPLLPQTQSGTRQFFLKAINNPSNAVASWVNASGFEENTASVVTSGTAGTIIPFSAGQFIYQYNSTSGSTGVKDAAFKENSLSTGAPYTLSGSTATPGSLFGSTSAAPTGTVGTFDRDVYSVVPTQVINGTSTYATNVKQLVTSTLPSSVLVGAYGFLSISYSATSSQWVHSPFEN